MIYAGVVGHGKVDKPTILESIRQEIHNAGLGGRVLMVASVVFIAAAAIGGILFRIPIKEQVALNMVVVGLVTAPWAYYIVLQRNTPKCSDGRDTDHQSQPNEHSGVPLHDKFVDKRETRCPGRR